MEKYLIKDTDGERVIVMTDNWTLSGNGLEFFVNNEKIAHFARFAYFKKIEEEGACS